MKTEEGELSAAAHERWFASRSVLMEAEVVWALVGKPPERGQFETPPSWVGKAIRAFANRGLGNPNGPPATEVLDTVEKQEAAAVGLKDAIEILARSISESSAEPKIGISAGVIPDGLIARLLANADAKTADAIGAITEKRAKMSVQEAVKHERFKVKGMEILTEADSLRSNILVPRIDIPFLLWIYWPQVILMGSVAGVSAVT